MNNITYGNLSNSSSFLPRTELGAKSMCLSFQCCADADPIVGTLFNEPSGLQLTPPFSAAVAAGKET